MLRGENPHKFSVRVVPVCQDPPAEALMSEIEKLLSTMKILRGENGCSWDREQTHASIRQNMLEEAYEAVDAINSNDMKHLKEELGDVLLQVVLHAQIADDEGFFNFQDVAKGINDKLIHRHPHVFSDTKVKNTDEILANWEKLKKEEKPHRKSVLDGISKAQSPLMTAEKLSKKAVKQGFEWPDEKSLINCVKSEFREFERAKTPIDKEMEFGDILFALVNLARWHKLDAEQCLIKANKKFETRFRKMEELALLENKPLKELSLDEWEELWQKAKTLTAQEY